MIEHLRERWQLWTGEEDTPFDDDAISWFTSAVVLTFLIFMLALIVPSLPQRPIELTSISEELEEPEEEVILEEIYFDSETSEDLGAMSNHMEEVAQAMAPTFADVSVEPVEVQEIEVPTETIELVTDIATAPVQNNMITQQGARVGQSATGAAGAVDRLTFEILQSLEQRKTLVVWMFDSTLSLKNTRGTIASRFKKIYEELGVLEEKGNSAFTKHDDKPLLSAVVAYGKDVKFLTEEPTADVAQMQQLVENIQHDKTGLENTFQAVYMSAQKFSDYRLRKRRNVMLIAVTDEIGSDEQHVDETIASVRRLQMPVYVLGVPAPFGRKTVPFRYVNDDPKYEETEYWIPVEQGPESLTRETVNLAFWGSNREQEAYELIDSGFGAYSLTRLCLETGGLYFSIHPNKTRYGRASGQGGRRDTPANSTLLYKFFDPAIMRAYAPDYMTLPAYKKMVQSNPARMALVQASNLRGADAIQNPATRFVVRGDTGVGDAAIEAQKQAARLEPVLLQMFTILEQGEKGRENLERPRWQAGFDLAYGRVMAARARTEGYNHMIAQIKSGKKFNDPKNNTWVLEHSEKIDSNSRIADWAKEAKMYLSRVVEQHPGTPWAYLAEKELSTPMGWEWKEEFTDLTPPQVGMGNGNNNNNPNDELNKLKRKPKAPKPPL